jgi:hypothetical protein
MNLLESILFLILYVGIAGIPLLWYAKQVNKFDKKQV